MNGREDDELKTIDQPPSNINVRTDDENGRESIRREDKSWNRLLQKYKMRIIVILICTLVAIILPSVLITRKNTKATHKTQVPPLTKFPKIVTGNTDNTTSTISQATDCLERMFSSASYKPGNIKMTFQDNIIRIRSLKTWNENGRRDWRNNQVIFSHPITTFKVKSVSSGGTDAMAGFSKQDKVGEGWEYPSNTKSWNAVLHYSSWGSIDHNNNFDGFENSATTWNRPNQTIKVIKNDDNQIIWEHENEKVIMQPTDLGKANLSFNDDLYAAVVVAGKENGSIDIIEATCE